MLFAIVLSCSPLARGDDWTALPAPSLCAERATLEAPQTPLTCTHLHLPSSNGKAERDRLPPRLPLSLVGQMLEEDARTRGPKLEFFRGGPELLVRGDTAAVAAARALIDDFGRAEEALAIDLVVTISPGRTAANEAAKTASTRYKKRVRSGEMEFFGLRQSQSYIADFAVEVAADSGVAQPVIGSVRYGTTLHVRAARVDSGRRVHLAGVLDLSELASVESFDPKSPDLGVIQQPVVHAAQVVFAGVVDSGQSLEVSLSNPALTAPDWTLDVRATARPDFEPKDGETSGWAMLDLSLLSSESTALPSFGPGRGLDADSALGEMAGTRAPLSASAVALALEASRAPVSGSRPAARAPLYWTNDLLFIPRSDPALVRDARALVHGAEAARVRTGRLEVNAGPARASIPICEGAPARLWIGTERPWLVDYQADLAPQTWMPSPMIETTFDGLALAVAAQAGVAQCSFWIAKSRPPTVVERDAAQLGRMQLLSRTLQSGSARVVAGEPEQPVLEIDPAVSLGLRYQGP